MYVRACCTEEREKRKQEENIQENEEASISFLEPSYDIIICAKQAVVARRDFRELPLLQLIHRNHQEMITVHDKASLNKKE